MTTRRLSIVVLAALAGALAGCGSSTAPGVTTAPAGPTASTPATTSTSASTSLPPALSHEPVVVAPKGPPPTHLVVKDIVKGTGQTAAPGDTITVNYVGVLYGTGKQFSSTWGSGGQPFTATLAGGANGVIAGWVKGIPGMKVGGRRELIIPPGMAYGKTGNSTIPPNSTLVFVIDLLSAR